MKHLKIALFFAVIAVAALFPTFSNFSYWGGYDWDQHAFYHESARIAILDYGQFPLWNAHYCGGTPLLANPQSGFLTPFFLPVLAFGAVAGLKIQALLYLFLGLLGTFLAARKIGCSNAAAIAASAIFMLSSWYALRVVVGHTTFFPFALMPWAFLFYLKSREQAKWLIAAAITLSIMFLAGGIYPFYSSMLLLGGYAALAAAEERKIKPLLIIAAILLLAAMVAAVKVIPALELTSAVPVQKDAQLTSAGIIARGMLHPSQGIQSGDEFTGRAAIPEGNGKELATLRGEVAWQWHEYSAYIGIIALLLTATALLNYRKNRKLLLLAAFFLALSWGNHSQIPVWDAMRNLPLFNALHGPSRFGIAFAFVIALLAARSLTALKLPHRKVTVTAIAAIIVIEHLVIFVPLLSAAFPIQPPANLHTENEQFIQFYTSAPYASQYPNLLQNLGTLNCYERIHVATKAVPQFVDGEPYPGFIGNAYIAETKQPLEVSYFSPNKVKVKVDEAETAGEATVVVNQNYYPGWKSSTGNEGSYGGLLATKITGNEGEVEFRFLPSKSVIAAAMSAVTLLLLLIIFFRPEIVRKLLFQEQS